MPSLARSFGPGMKSFSSGLIVGRGWVAVGIATVVLDLACTVVHSLALGSLAWRGSVFSTTDPIFCLQLRMCRLAMLYPFMNGQQHYRAMSLDVHGICL